MSKPLSVFGGTGFVGSEFCRRSSRKCTLIPRESREPQDEDLLYLISTTHNYHVFDDVHRPVNGQLWILVICDNEAHLETGLVREIPGAVTCIVFFRGR